VQVVQVRDVRFNILVNIALTLVDDRVHNVRLALCQLVDVLRGHIVDHSRRYQQERRLDSCTGTGTGDDHSNSSLALRAVGQLLADSDRDVRFFAQELHDHVEADYQQYCASVEEEEEGEEGSGSQVGVS
jgi:hypothetical protein